MSQLRHRCHSFLNCLAEGRMHPGRAVKIQSGACLTRNTFFGVILHFN